MSVDLSSFHCSQMSSFIKLTVTITQAWSFSEGVWSPARLLLLLISSFRFCCLLLLIALCYCCVLTHYPIKHVPTGEMTSSWGTLCLCSTGKCFNVDSLHLQPHILWNFWKCGILPLTVSPHKQRKESLILLQSFLKNVLMVLDIRCCLWHKVLY